MVNAPELWDLLVCQQVSDPTVQGVNPQGNLTLCILGTPYVLPHLWLSSFHKRVHSTRMLYLHLR